MKIKAAFFDRDGTLIEEVNYLDSIDKIKLIPAAIKLCRYLQNNGYKLFVVTNQSGIARGFFDKEFVIKTHDYLKKLFEKENVFFEQFYFCPHLPVRPAVSAEALCEGRECSRIGNGAVKKELLINCNCRKPNPGMILQAAKDFNIDLKESLMFGDKISDIKAGQAAGCKSFNIHDFLNEHLHDFVCNFGFE